MNRTAWPCFALPALFLLFASTREALAQEPPGPQMEAPPPVAPPPQPAAARAGSGERIRIPSGTRVGVVLENGISTRSAKVGDSLCFRTSFPITQNNHIVIPVG
jgi:hypothetical protein